jgi:hypothetical protein
VGAKEGLHRQKWERGVCFQTPRAASNRFDPILRASSSPSHRGCSFQMIPHFTMDK